jgi:hypothetical protein
MLRDFMDSHPKDAVRLVQQAVERLLQFGQQVGVSPDEILSLLLKGMSVPDLLLFLDSKKPRSHERQWQP